MALPMKHFLLQRLSHRSVSLCETYLHKGIRSSASLQKLTPKNVKGKASSHEWITRQLNDPYVRQAKEDNYRCRSAYKLIEVDNKYAILKPGIVIVDCGAAPGSWSQVAVERTSSKRHSDLQKRNGHIISVDLQHIDAISGVTIFSRSDFTSDETRSKILEALNGELVDVVLSDMAPSASGNRDLDHDSICNLCLSVLEFSSKVLNNGGHVLCKLWDGQDREKMVLIMKRMFRNVHVLKPKASRTDSAEIFLLGMDFFLRKKS